MYIAVHLIALSIVFVCAAKSSEQESSTMPVKESFKKDGVVPDVVSTAPSKPVDVDYSGHKVELGNELTPTQVADQPKVSWEADSGSLYTFIMSDPDAPSRKKPSAREWLHWLVINIPGDNVSKGKTLTSYMGAQPPSGTGLHRYVFVAYKQPGEITDSKPGGRAGFSVAKFAQKHNLGNPIAGNFFQAQH